MQYRCSQLTVLFWSSSAKQTGDGSAIQSAGCAQHPRLAAGKTGAENEAKPLTFLPRWKVWLLSQEFFSSPPPLGFFLSLALPVFPGASHSSAWMYFLLFWQVASLAGLEREALWMVTIAANNYTKDHVIDNKWSHKCKEIFSTFFFFFFFSSAWFLTLCHLSVCHIILDLHWTCHDQEPALPAHFNASSRNGLWASKSSVSSCTLGQQACRSGCQPAKAQPASSTLPILNPEFESTVSIQHSQDFIAGE